MTPTLFSIVSAFYSSLMGLALNRSHLILALLCLEGAMLSVFLMISMWPAFHGPHSVGGTPLILLALAACEAGTGLALMVATARTHGTDHLKALNLLQC
uniref:NADH-ubiquinone oxidoreductase chain 4L n=1 Tax=Protopterus aethiopicus TaxID=7886 RepID=E3WCN1_PROAT|nr:NADH dehydrogenase subunit 4L [Protopterus aethiopicus]BAJ40858.1 NADH dehydrogenase subunit 4L [Protopterus aethiopicus]